MQKINGFVGGDFKTFMSENKNLFNHRTVTVNNKCCGKKCKNKKYSKTPYNKTLESQHVKPYTKSDNVSKSYTIDIIRAWNDHVCNHPYAYDLTPEQDKGYFGKTVEHVHNRCIPLKK